MAIDKTRQFETVCSLTTDYVRAYIQNTNFDPQEKSLHAEHIAACFHLARVTIELFEKEFLAINNEEKRSSLH